MISVGREARGVYRRQGRGFHWVVHWATLLLRMRPIFLLSALLLAACGPGLTPLPPPVSPYPDSEAAPPPPTPLPTAGRPVIPDDDAALVARELLIPVAGVSATRLQDSFLAKRDGNRVHAAIDIMAPRGTPVLSADAGSVWKVRSNALGGLTVYAIDDEQRFVYYYAHLDRYADGLKEGQRVARGDVLGYVGTTGNAPPNTPHLHFQLMRYRGNGRWWDGDPINPYPYFTRKRAAQR